MKEKERVIVGGLVALMLVVWLGFPFHQAPRFAGSFAGGMLAVLGTALMLVPLAYMLVKRNKRVKAFVTPRISMRTLLAWHIYAGVLGPLLVVIHSGHKYESPLGIALTALTLLVVLSGFVGRYLMNQFSREIREKKAILQSLEVAYAQAAGQLAAAPDQAVNLRPFSTLAGRLLAGLFAGDASMPAAARQATAADPATLLHLTQSIADVEYAIRTHEEFRKWFAKWLKFHIWISVALYVLIALHVWAAIYFGLRWFEPDAARHYRTAAAVAAPAVAAPAVAGPEDHVGPGRTAVDAGVARFSSHYAALFRRYWRPAVRVHDIRTTVFDYAGIASETRSPESDFSAAEMALRRVRVDGLRGDDAEKAFWINAYNFGAMSLAAKNYPIPSIVDSRISAANPWGVPAVWIGDKSYSLQQIENEILLRKFDDARIVFAISCAAVSCPDRSDEIFAADRIDRQLDAMVRGLLANSSKGLMIDRDRNLVTISWIFKADQRLFRGGQAGVLRFVIRYAPPDARAWLIEHAEDVSVRYFTHDWSLNDAALADTGTEG